MGIQECGGTGEVNGMYGGKGRRRQESCEGVSSNEIRLEIGGLLKVEMVKRSRRIEGVGGLLVLCIYGLVD